MLDSVVAERLVRLRVLLSAALAGATDGTATGRHISVIFLDGVAELALHLAADEVGVDVKPTHGLEVVYGNVAGELQAWDRRSWKGVRELHRSRNNLQHHGILPDAQHLPVWVAEVDRFVHSLTAAAFGVHLATVRAADAVDDPELRDHLRAGEAAIDAEQFAEAVQGAKQTLDLALSRFRGRSSMSRFPFDTFDELKQLDRALVAVEEFIDIAYLATDPAEWLWLKRVEQLSHSQPLAKADAQRAVSFVTGWILRYEAFAARLPKRREPAYIEPSLDEKYVRPQIVSAEVGEDDDFDRSPVVRLELNELPPRWTDSLHNGLRAAQDAGEAPPNIWASRSEGGFTLRVPPDFEGSQLRALADTIIRRTHEIYEGHLDARRASRDAGDELAERYAEVLTEDERVTEVTAEHWGGDRRSIVRVSIEDPRATDINHYLIETVLNEEPRGQSRVHVGFRGGQLSFAEDQYAPDEVLPAFEDALKTATRRAAQQRAAAEESEQRRGKLLSDARKAFADVLRPEDV